MQEVEALIRAKQEEMERSTLTIKEEKQRLLEMKRMKDDARQASALCSAGLPPSPCLLPVLPALQSAAP